MAKSNFIVRGGGNFNPLYQEFNKAQKKMSSFQKGISGTMKTIGAALGGLAVGKLIKDSTKAAMGVESSLDNIARNMEQSSDAFNEWVQTQSKSLAMAKDEAYQYGSTFSNLLGSFLADSKETANQTQELMKAAAIISSKTGRTYDDVANRIRSGMLGSTEAIEDLGVYTQVSMLESTEAFKKFANGKSWAQLDFQTQQQIRLAAILEQSFNRYGDTLAGTTQTRQQIFLATLKNIRLNLGQAFLPIYNVILPALTSLASKIESITASLAAFTQALFGKSVKAQTKQTQAQAAAIGELGDATEEAGKQAKGSLAGFDEINKLGKTDGGAGAVVGIGAIESPIIEQTDDGTGGAMGQMATKASEAAEKIRTAFTNMKNAIVENKDLILPAIGAIVGALVGLATYNGISSLIGSFKLFLSGIKLAWAALLAHPMVAVAAAIGALVGAFIVAYNTNDEFREKVDKLWARIKDALTPVIKTLGDMLTWLWQSIIVPVGRVLIDVLKAAFEGVSYSAKWLWTYVLEPLGKFLMSVLSPIFEVVSKVLINIFKFAVDLVIKSFEFLWYNVLKPITTWLGSTFKPVFEFIGKSIKLIIEGLQLSFEGLIMFITGVFTANWKKAWEGIRTIFKGTFGTLWDIAKVPLNLIINAINKVIDGLNSLSMDIPDWVPVFGGKTWGISIPNIPRLATGAITGVNSPFTAVVGDNKTQREVISPLDDLLGMITTAVSSAVGDNQGSNINLTVKIGEDTITNKVISNINRQSRISGKTVITV